MLGELDVSASDLNRVLRRSRDELFALATVGKPPIGIMLGGQPASGKSLLIRRLLSENPAIGFIVINGDDFRPLHPRFAEFNQLSEQDSAVLTQPFVNYIGQALLKEALQNRFNIIIEGTMRRAQVPITTAERFHSAGYQVEAHVLAVAAMHSIQGIYNRYESQKQLGQAGRFSPLFIHDEAYAGLLFSVDQLYETRQVDRLFIYNRGAQLILADYRLESGQWRGSMSQTPSLVIAAERERVWSLEEKQAYAAIWQAIIDLRAKRGAALDPVPMQLYEQILQVIGERV